MLGGYSKQWGQTSKCDFFKINLFEKINISQVQK
jgi:hypothetical protein